MSEFKHLDELFQKFVDDGLPGCSCVIAKKGEILYENYFGYSDIENKVPLTENNLFRQASLTKIAMYTTAMMLYEQGKFLMTDPIYEYFPEWRNTMKTITLPNGKVVGATGDQWQDDGSDLKWLKDIHLRLPKIDILAMDCWIHDYDEHVADFSPRLLISQHENEIGAHGIDHREAYWMTIYKNTHFHQNPTPYVLMAWGEWYDYK
jgi:hypothetical protein